MAAAAGTALEPLLADRRVRDRIGPMFAVRVASATSAAFPEAAAKITSPEALSRTGTLPPAAGWTVPRQIAPDMAGEMRSGG